MFLHVKLLLHLTLLDLKAPAYSISNRIDPCCAILNVKSHIKIAYVVLKLKFPVLYYYITLL